MARNKHIPLLLGLLGGGGLSWPLDFDFSAMADGALPAPLIGGTWSVSSGAAVNGATPGADLLTDGSLEANYTAGKCDSLNKAGTPTLAESSDAYDGVKAQEFTAGAGGQSVSFPNNTPVAGQFYRFRGYGKRTAGSTSSGAQLAIEQGPLFISARPISSATYAAIGTVIRAESTAGMGKYAIRAGDAPHDTVIGDAYTLQKYTTSEMFSLFDSGRANVTLKVRGTWNTTELFGLIARADNTTNPQNFISLIWIPDLIATSFLLDKWIGGVPTTVAKATVIGSGEPSASQDMELRLSGTTVQMYWNGTQVGTDYTISDAAIVTNDIHGFLASGGSQVTRFFAAAG
jgi:hypothetical protein